MPDSTEAGRDDATGPELPQSVRILPGDQPGEQVPACEAHEYHCAAVPDSDVRQVAVRAPQRHRQKPRRARCDTRQHPCPLRAGGRAAAQPEQHGNAGEQADRGSKSEAGETIAVEMHCFAAESLGQREHYGTAGSTPATTAAGVPIIQGA